MNNRGNLKIIVDNGLVILYNSCLSSNIDYEDRFLKISGEFRNNRKKLKIRNEHVRQLKTEIINDDILSNVQ